SLMLVFLCSCWSLSAQIKTNFELSTQTGMEYNVFKAPAELWGELSELGRNGDILTSAYQKIRFRTSMQKAWGKQKISLTLQPKLQWYLNEQEVSYTNWYTRLRYDYRFSKALKWQSNLRYQLNARAGTNVGDGEFVTPLGYQNFDWNNRLQFRLSKKNRSQVKLSLGKRDYRDGDTNQLQYHFVRMEAEYKNLFKKDKLKHHYGFRLDWSKRFYKRSFTDKSRAARLRSIDYLSLGIFYSHSLTKYFRLQPTLTFKRGIDSNRGRLSYNQIRPSIELQYQRKKWRIELRGSWIYKQYTSFYATDLDDEELEDLLTFNYLQLKFTLRREITDQLFFSIDGHLNNRMSNKLDFESASFRSYLHAYFGVGIKWLF
ncbi:MAG: hypothetical protein AAF985_24400, partial [Bacteroidota bacterium]